MRLFNKKKKDAFMQDLKLSIETTKVEDDEIDEMNPFSLHNFKDTTQVEYPRAKGDPTNVYNFMNSSPTINNIDSQKNEETHINSCCIIL